MCHFKKMCVPCTLGVSVFSVQDRKVERVIANGFCMKFPIFHFINNRVYKNIKYYITLTEEIDTTSVICVYIYDVIRRVAYRASIRLIDNFISYSPERGYYMRNYLVNYEGRCSCVTRELLADARDNLRTLLTSALSVLEDLCKYDSDISSKIETVRGCEELSWRYFQQSRVFFSNTLLYLLVRRLLRRYEITRIVRAHCTCSFDSNCHESNKGWENILNWQSVINEYRAYLKR